MTDNPPWGVQHVNHEQFKAVSVHDLRHIAPEYGMTIRAWPSHEDAVTNHATTPEVGHIDLQHDNTIRGVWTRPEHRRHGVASALLHLAEQQFGPIKHAPDRTDSGEAWARKNGASPRERSTKWDGYGMYEP